VVFDIFEKMVGDVVIEITSRMKENGELFEDPSPDKRSLAIGQLA
jgi:hypothetical protein